MNLVERELLLSQLMASWHALPDGGRVVLLTGEAGIGKSCLVRFFAGQLATPRALWGICDNLFTPRPLGPLYDIAAEASGELPGLLASSAPRPLLFAACLRELQQAKRLVIVEDIHWADDATLDLLSYLVRRTHLTQSLLVLTLRDDELALQDPARRLLADVAAAPTALRLPVLPLTVDGIQQLTGKPTGEARALHQRTAGNPFFVTEILAGNPDQLPASVRDAVLGRVAGLSRPGRAALDAAAVLGPRFEPWLLTRVARIESVALDENLDLGVLVVQGDSLAFRHELAREVIYEAIPPHQRQFLHGRTLDELRRSAAIHEDVTRIAHHAAAAHDAEAIRLYAPQAGRAAAVRGMHRAAATQFKLALEYVDDLDPLDHIELLEAYALSAQGDPARTETIAAYRAAAEIAAAANLPRRQGFDLVRLSGVLGVINQKDEAARCLSEALAILEPLAPNRGLIDAYRLLAMEQLSAGQPEAAVNFARRAHDMALETDHAHVIISSAEVLGLCLLPIDHGQGCTQLEQCLQAALEQSNYWVLGALYPNLAMTYIDVYRLEPAEALLAAGLPFTIEHDMEAATVVLHAWEAMLRLYRGQWEECLSITNGLLARPNLSPSARCPTLTAKARILGRQGDVGAAQNLVDEALAASLHTGNRQRQGVYYCAAAEIAWLAGDHARLRRHLDAFEPIALTNRQPGFAAELAYWRWHLDGRASTAAWMVPAFVAEIEGEWQTAADLWGAAGCPYEQARALAYGPVAAQTQSLVLLETMGAGSSLLAGQLRRQLQAAGAPLPRGPRPTTRSNPYQLTARQLEVLMLLAQGLSNTGIGTALHISPKTVEHHVSAVLGKLGAATREEAAELVRQHPDILSPK